MSKHPTRHKEREATTTPKAPKQGLDEHITELTIKLRKGVERHWTILVALIVVATAGVLAFQAVEALGDRREDRLQAELYRLTHRHAGEEPDPDVAALEGFLDEVEGARAERGAYRGIVTWLLQAALPPPPDESPRRRELLEAAASIAARGAERFPDDEDMQAWAAAVQARVGAETDTGWLPRDRQYGLKEPGEPESDAATGEPESDAATGEPESDAAPGEPGSDATPESTPAEEVPAAGGSEPAAVNGQPAPGSESRD